MNNNSADSLVKPVSQITIRIDSETLAIFKAHAKAACENYQTLMSEALQQFARDFKLVNVLEEETRQEYA